MNKSKTLLMCLASVCATALLFQLKTDIPTAVANIYPATVAVHSIILTKIGKEISIKQSSGSGTIIQPTGIILTNYHVVAGAVRITINLYNGQTSLANIVGIDKAHDLALLRINRSNLPYLRLGNADALPRGTTLISVGNGHNLGRNGDLSVSVGVLSGKHRFVNETEWFETDAHLQPGCSGGPVCDLKTNLVGINVAVSGYMKGFFIPINDETKAVLNNMLSALNEKI